MSRWRLASFPARIQIFHRQIEFSLFIVDNSSFFDTQLAHIAGMASGRQGFDGLVVMSELFFADAFAEIGESFGFIEFYGGCEIFQGVEVVIFF